MTATPKLADVAPTPEAAVIIGTGLDTFRYLAKQPGFPASIKIGGTRFYSRRELADWKRRRDAGRATK